MQEPINIIKVIKSFELKAMTDMRSIQQEIADLRHTVTQLLLASEDPEAEAIKFADGSAANYDGHDFTKDMRDIRSAVGFKNSELTAADVNSIIYNHWDVITASSKLRYRPFIHFYPGMLEMGMAAPICGRSLMLNPVAMHSVADKYTDDLGLRSLGLEVDLDTDEKMVVFAVTHEFCHIQQSRAGRLTQQGPDLIWEGAVFDRNADNQVSMGIVTKERFKEYVALPWEVEANRCGVHAVQEIWG